MNRSPLRIFAACVVAVPLLILVGCGGSSRRSELPPATPEGASQLISKNYNALQRFEGDFTVSLRALLYKGNFFGQCWIEHPEMLAASLRAPLGIRIGDLVVDGKQYELKMGSGRVMSGGVDSLDMRQLTGIDLPAKDLVLLFDPIPRPPRKNVRTIDFKVLGDDSLWVWQLDEGGLDRHISIDPAERAVIEASWTDAHGTTVMKKSYMDYHLDHGILLASHVSVAAKGKLPVVLDVVFNRSEVNPTWKDDPFQFKWVTR